MHGPVDRHRARGGEQHMIERIADGRTDLVFDHVAQGHPADSVDANGVRLVAWCAYYGDVSAIRFLLSSGETPASLGENLGLNAAAYHGHWRLCQFVIEQGADVNRPLTDTGETALHAALCKPNRPSYDFVLRVLLASGADPNRACRVAVATEAFMRDARTKGETPLHRAAAFGSAEAIQLLLDAGARRDVRDAAGDSPLGWASWHLRPDRILRMLDPGGASIHPDRNSTFDHGAGWGEMEVSLLGKPHL
jgi:ankyrin repeat protein